MSLLGLYWEGFSLHRLKRKWGKRIVGVYLLYRQQEIARKTGILAWEGWYPDTAGTELAFLLQVSVSDGALWGQFHCFLIWSLGQILNIQLQTPGFLFENMDHHVAFVFSYWTFLRTPLYSVHPIHHFQHCLLEVFTSPLILRRHLTLGKRQI